MILDWNAFTPGAALLGGAMIGLAATVLALGASRVLGVSGILAGAVKGLWRWENWTRTTLILAVLAVAVSARFAATQIPPNTPFELTHVGLVILALLVSFFGAAGIIGVIDGGRRGLWRGDTPERAVRWAFLGGLLAAPWLWQLFAPLPVAHFAVGTPGLVVAGLLVGFGVRMGNGCTSGHGVCGLARGSLRSGVNVGAFMAAGFMTVFVLRHVLGAGGVL